MTTASTLPACHATGPTSPRPALHLLIGFCLLLAGASAQAADWMNPFKLFGGEEELVIWQGPGQYVKIVEQDRFKKYSRAPKNDHPANIGAKDIAVVLTSLSIGAEGGATKGGTPLFTPAEAAGIAPKIAEALGKAQSKQDVIFAVSDAHGKSARLATAGRVFISEGQLNIILGDTQQSGASGTEQAINHHVAPWRPGQRRESMDTAKELGGGPGTNFRPGIRSSRYDWAIIDVKTMVAAYRGPQIPIAAAPAVALPVEAGAQGAPEDTAKLLQERQQMREEMARMRKQMDAEQTDSPAPAPAAPPVPVPQPAAAPAPSAIPKGTRAEPASQAPAASAAAPARPATGAESVEQRLSTLQSLHAKKLITDEEYAAKRKKILEEL